jgi:hypothetical protein
MEFVFFIVTLVEHYGHMLDHVASIIVLVGVAHGGTVVVVHHVVHHFRPRRPENRRE